MLQKAALKQRQPGSHCLTGIWLSIHSSSKSHSKHRGHCDSKKLCIYALPLPQGHTASPSLDDVLR